MMSQETLLQQIVDYRKRANPYPLYAELRKTPVSRQSDGTYAVSTYREIVALLHDPRVSSDLRNRSLPIGADSLASQGMDGGSAPSALDQPQQFSPSFLMLDPSEHDRLRRLAMRQFGPPHSPGRVHDMRPDLITIVDRLIDQFQGQRQVDIVDSFAYPFPVTVICELLGVPRQDEPCFHGWADAIANILNALVNQAAREELTRKSMQAHQELAHYIAGLIEMHRKQPGKDMLSGLVTDAGPDGQMSQGDLIATSILLLIAGHETTVNLISNGALTLLRHPAILEQLRREPDLIVGTVEELLRYEPPVQLVPQRTPLEDIAIAGMTIPKGVPLTLVLAAGSRDPQRFLDPERFDPWRKDNQHLGFGSGIHNCFGAPLARLEAQVALNELFRRLENPRLVMDPPPYRQNPVLRGPRQLLIEVDGVRK
ncbi:MAG TPA: cytochrome P450 [Ktedonobacteraceae bacterium]|nr:cytochrome P450 [Ktedonobacteraceae bacterium]